MSIARSGLNCYSLGKSFAPILSNVCVKCGKKQLFIGTVILGVYLPFPNRHDHGGDARVPTSYNQAHSQWRDDRVSRLSLEMDHFYFILFFYFFFVNENMGPSRKNSGPNPGTFRVLVGVYPGLRQTTTPMKNKKFHLCTGAHQASG